jgi:hypothetical protein
VTDISASPTLFLATLEERQMTEMQITITEIVPGGQAANGKDRPTSIHTADGQKLKCWPNKVGSMVAGRTYLVPVVTKQYQGIESFEIGNGIIKEVQANSAPVSPSQAPQGAPPPAQAQPPVNTPMGVVSAGAGSKDRSIQALAIIKAVVAVGGTEGEVQRWMDCHDRLVAGEQVG